jgi:alpha-L-arabinofuranosidase
LFARNQRYVDAGDGVLDLSTLASDPTIVPIRADVLAYARQAGITGLRFPGGSVGIAYNWKNGIGPVLRRPTCTNYAGAPSACYAYGIMEAMEFAEALGPQSVAWTEIVLSNTISAENAAEFVAFVNAPDDGSNPWAALRAEYGHPQPYGVHYWCIGNEVKPLKVYYPDATAWLNGYAQSGQTMWDGALNIMSAMKAVDPTIAVGSGWIVKNNDLFNALQGEGARFDFVDLHNLTNGHGSGTTTATENYTTVRAAAGISTKTVALQDLINGAQYPSLQGMTVLSSEIDVGDVALRFSLSHALAEAVALNSFIANDLTLEEQTPFSALVSHPPAAARSEDLEWFPVAGGGEPPGDQYGDWVATAPSYTYQLYANYLGTQSVAAAITSAPTEKVGRSSVQTLYVTAALNARGSVLGLMVTNADLSASWSVPITVQGFSAATGTVEQVDGPDVTSVNTLAAPDTVGISALPGFSVPGSGVFTYTFPPHSITAIDLLAPLPPPGTISGAVTDSMTGSGIPGATVSDTAGSSTADGDGGYTLSDVPSGAYTVTASAPGYASLSVQASVAADTTTSLNFNLVPEAGAITGTVTDSLTGTGIPGATVADTSGMSTSDDDGIYVLPVLSEGSYTVTASAPGYASQSVTASVAPGATTTSDLTLVPDPGTISGTVTDSVTAMAVAGATVSDGASTTSTDGNGAYALNMLPEGGYTITVSAPTYQAQSVAASVAPGATTMVNISLVADPGAITGTVTDALTGNAIPGATISDGAGTTNTDGNGVYALSGITEGSYTITASASGYQAQGIIVSVAPSATATVNFSLVPEPGAISGTVMDSVTSNAIPGATISDGAGGTSTDGNGDYALSMLSEGSYTITASAPGYHAQSVTASVVPGATTTVNFTLVPL